MANAKEVTQNVKVVKSNVVNMDGLSFTEAMAKYNTNEIKLAGTVVEMRVSEPRPKLDKNTKEPILDDNGQAEFWDPFYSVSIIFEGAELNVNVDKKLYERIELSKRYMFLGRMGMSFKKTQPIFSSAVLFA